MKRLPSVRKNSEFQEIYKNGTPYTNRLLVMYVVESGEDRNRIGISVSKKVGNNVARHRIIRFIREISRLDNRRLKTGLNTTVVTRATAKTPEYKDLEGVYIHLCGPHHILRESK